MTHADPRLACFYRLIAVRPDCGDLRSFERELTRSLEVRLEDEAPSYSTSFWLGPELSRCSTKLRCICHWEGYDGGTVVLTIRLGALQPGDTPIGTSELGPILSMDEYIYGADLLAVRDAGLRLSWPTACWLYGAARETFVLLHHMNGQVHGNLRHDQVRFAIFSSDTGPVPFEEPAPFRFLNAQHNRAGTEIQRAHELSVLARAIAELTTHPDPVIDALLHDSGRDSQEELRVVLQRNRAPVDALLRDRANATDLALSPPEDNDNIDIELVALWRTVVALEPMIEPQVPSAWARKFTLERMPSAEVAATLDEVRAELARLHHESDTSSIDEEARAGRVARERELVAQYGWDLAGEVTKHAVAFELVGGSVHAVSMSAGQFHEHGNRLFAAQPIRKLRLRPSNDVAIASLARAPNLRTLRALQLFGGDQGYIDPLNLSGLQDAALDALEELEFLRCGLDDDTEPVLANLIAPNLRALRLHAMYVSGGALRGLAENTRLFESLEVLECSLVGPVVAHKNSTEIPQELATLATQLIAGLRLPQLRRLSVTTCWFATDAGAARLVRQAPELTTLEFHNARAPQTVDAAIGCRTLEELILVDWFDLDTLARLLALPRLRVLQLQAESDAHRDELAKCFMALPTTHPLRHVQFVGYYKTPRPVQERFPWLDED